MKMLFINNAKCKQWNSLPFILAGIEVIVRLAAAAMVVGRLNSGAFFEVDGMAVFASGFDGAGLGAAGFASVNFGRGFGAGTGLSFCRILVLGTGGTVGFVACAVSESVPSPLPISLAEKRFVLIRQM